MATVTPTITPIGGNGQVMKATWVLTSANSDGAPIGNEFAEFADRTVYFLGTFATATAAIEGGDGSTYVALTDPQGNVISKTANSIEVITEVPEYTRPNLSTPGAGATITATIIMRRGFKRGP